MLPVPGALCEKKKKIFFFFPSSRGGGETQVFFLRCFSAPIQPAGRPSSSSCVGWGNAAKQDEKKKKRYIKDRGLEKKDKTRGNFFFSVSLLGLFWNEIYLEWHLWASFRIHRTQNCPPALIFFLPTHLLLVLLYGRSRFYQLERLYTHTHIFLRLDLKGDLASFSSFGGLLCRPLFFSPLVMSKSFHHQHKLCPFPFLLFFWKCWTHIRRNNATWEKHTVWRRRWGLKWKMCSFVRWRREISGKMKLN